MNALTNTGPAIHKAPLNPNSLGTLILDVPTAKSVHATLRDLQKVINASVGERHHTEEDILAVANALGLSPVIREEGERSTNVDYGLPATDASPAEVFFHVCFLPHLKQKEAPRMAGFLTIYTNPMARRGLPENQ
jgi:hypothetical protein